MSNQGLPESAGNSGSARPLSELAEDLRPFVDAVNRWSDRWLTLTERAALNLYAAGGCTGDPHAFITVYREETLVMMHFLNRK